MTVDNELINRKKAAENALLSKVDKELLVKDILSEDIQKKRKQIEKFA